MSVVLDLKAIVAGIVGAAVFASLALLVLHFSAVQPPPRGEIAAYSELQKLAIANTDALVERGVAFAVALIGLLGTAVLGFNERLKLSRTDSIGLGITLYFCVMSVTAGVFVKIKLVEMVGRGVAPYVTDSVVNLPLSTQLYSMVAAIGALAWTIVYRTASAKE